MIHRELWKKELLRDYPNLLPMTIEMLLDVYERNPDFFKKQKTRGRPRKNDKGHEVIQKLDDAICELQCVEFREPTPVDTSPKKALNIINPLDETGKPESVTLTF